MLTVFDKAIAAMLPGALLWLNQKYGFRFDTSPETMAAIASVIGALLVYFVPNADNKVNVSPSSGKFGAGGAVLLFFLLGAHDAKAADVGKAPALVPVSTCTQQNCSGFYVGGMLVGQGTNMDIIGSGINGSVFGGGASIGLDAGYQFWNGSIFFALEGFGAYGVSGNPVIDGSGSRSNWIFGQVAKLGGNLSGLIATPGPTTPSQGAPINIPTQLANSIISPYIQFGAVERPWGTGWATGAGADFIIASGWNLDLSYMFVKYSDPNLTLTQSEKSENLIKLSINRKF